jgi:anti-sigma B factor antagonist
VKEELTASIKTTTREIDSVTVVGISGRITLGEGCAQLRELIQAELARGNKRLLLNLADFTYIDSSGTGELVRA